jgi:hypothetical protein
LLPKEYKWACQGRQNKERRRAAGGIITGVTLGIKKRQEKGKEEGCMEKTYI